MSHAAIDFLRRDQRVQPCIMTFASGRCIHPRAPTLEDAESLLGRHPDADFYYVMADLVDAHVGKPNKGDCIGSRTVWCDLDPPKGVAGRAELRAWRRRALGDLAASGLPRPQLCIHSGRGLWLRWQMPRRLSIEEAEALCNGVDLALDGDHCHNIDRVARLPGTRNTKTGLRARVLWWDDGETDPAELPVVPPVDWSEVTATVNVDQGDTTKVSDEVLSAFMLSPATRRIIQHGYDTVEHPDSTLADVDRNRPMFGAICAMLRARVPHQTIYKLLRDEDRGISAHILWERGGKRRAHPERYAVKQIKDALRRVLHDAADDAIPEGAIQVDNPRVDLFVREVETALMARAPETIFRRGAELVRVVRIEDELEVGGVKYPVGSITLGPVTRNYLDCLVGELGIAFYKQPRAGQPSVVPPRDLWRLLTDVDQLAFPGLQGVTSTPTTRHQAPGYDPKALLYHTYKEGDFPPIPRSPSKEEAEAALARLLHPYRDFPFASDLDRSVLASALLCGVNRRAMGLCPMHLFDASAAGAGKTKLANCVAIVATGLRAVATSQPGTDEDELRKKLFAILLRGSQVVLIDNINHTLRGTFLDMMMTSERVTDRVLSESREAEVSTRVLLMGTGNNVVVGGAHSDTADRVVVCRLEPPEEDWRAHSFDFDPVDEVTAARPQMVADALTVLHAVDYHDVYDMVGDWGDFRDWTTVRAGLVWLGMPDPAESTRQVKEADSHRESEVAFFELMNRLTTVRENGASETAWFRANKWDGHGTTADDDLHLWEERRQIAEHLPRGDWSAWALGRKLGGLRGKVVAGWRLERHVGNKTEGIQWRIARPARKVEG